MVELQICLCTGYVLISPRVYTRVASLISGMWSGPRHLCAFSLVCIHLHACPATSEATYGRRQEESR